MDLKDIDQCENIVIKVTEMKNVKAFPKPDFDLYQYFDYCADDSKLLTYGPILLNYLYKEKEYYEDLNVAYQAGDLEHLEHRIECRKKVELLESKLKSKEDKEAFEKKMDDIDNKYRNEKLEEKKKRRTELNIIKQSIDNNTADDVFIDDKYFEDLDVDELDKQELQYVSNIRKKYKNMYSFFEEIEKHFSAYLYCSSDKHPLTFEYLHNNPDERQTYLDTFYDNADKRNIPYRLTAYKYKKTLKPLLDDVEKIYERKTVQAKNKHHAYMLEHNSKKVMCVCGAEVSAGNMSKHRQTKRHLDYISKHN